MFSELITLVEENGAGIHAYRKAANMACNRASETGEQAAGWFLLASFADMIVEQNERIAVTSIQTSQWFSAVKTEVERLNKAFSNSDPAGRLDALNQTAQILVNQAA